MLGKLQIRSVEDLLKYNELSILKVLNYEFQGMAQADAHTLQKLSYIPRAINFLLYDDDILATILNKIDTYSCAFAIMIESDQLIFDILPDENQVGIVEIAEISEPNSKNIEASIW